MKASELSNKKITMATLKSFIKKSDELFVEVRQKFSGMTDCVEVIEDPKTRLVSKNEINLSMPESMEYYEIKLEQAKQRHEGLKNGSIQREHSFSLTYAKKEVNELIEKVLTAKKLWE